VRRTDSSLAPEPLAEAVADVYRGCQRAPPRLTLVTHDPVEFVRLLHAAGRVFKMGDAILLLVCSCTGIGLVVAGASATPSGGGLLVLSAINGLFLLIISLGSDLGAEPPPGRMQADLFGTLLITLLVSGAAGCIGGSAMIAAATFGVVSAIVGIGRAATMLNGGLPGRVGLAVRFRRRLDAVATAPMNDTVRRVLRQAVSSQELARAGQRTDDPTKAEAWHRIEELARRRIGTGWRDVEPVLGRLLPAASRGALDTPGSDAAGSPTAALVALDCRCEAAGFFEQAAVLLLSGRSAAESLSPFLPRLRWRRAPYARALSLLQASPFLYLLIAMVPSDRSADKVLARAVAAEPDPTLRLDAMTHMGFERFFSALAIRPIDSGASGDLYVTGFGDSTTALLRVVDRVRGADGSPHVHWLPVPPGTSSAREAVAWTFGKSAREWDPVLET
jgi:hypothetical protein